MTLPTLLIFHNDFPRVANDHHEAGGADIEGAHDDLPDRDRDVTRRRVPGEVIRLHGNHIRAFDHVDAAGERVAGHHRGDAVAGDRIDAGQIVRATADRERRCSRRNVTAGPD